MSHAVVDYRLITVRPRLSVYFPNPYAECKYTEAAGPSETELEAVFGRTLEKRSGLLFFCLV